MALLGDREAVWHPAHLPHIAQWDAPPWVFSVLSCQESGVFCRDGAAFVDGVDGARGEDCFGPWVVIRVPIRFSRCAPGTAVS